MKNYFNLTVEEKKELANKENFTPDYFAKLKSTTTTTTIKPQ